MELPEITLIPIVVLACLVVGFLIKHTPPFAKLANAYIPLIVAVLGAILGCVQLGVSLDAIVGGAISGLASTGLHQLFTKFIGQKGEE